MSCTEAGASDIYDFYTICTHCGSEHCPDCAKQGEGTAATCENCFEISCCKTCVDDAYRPLGTTDQYPCTLGHCESCNKYYCAPCSFSDDGIMYCGGCGETLTTRDQL
jgi:hypothetical protein